MLTPSEYLGQLNQIISLLINAAKTKEDFDNLTSLFIEILKSDLTKIDREMFHESLNPLPVYSKPVTEDRIIEAAGKVFNIDPEMILISASDDDLVLAREICMYIMHTDLEMSLIQIADLFNTDGIKVKKAIHKFDRVELGSELLRHKVAVLDEIYKKSLRRRVFIELT